MRVNVDEKALNDPRFRRLARTLELTHVDYAIGMVVRVWLAALNRVDDANPDGLLARDDAEDATDHRTLIESMIACGLAEERTSGMLYFHGIAERAEFLRLQRRKGSQGGRPKAENNPGLSKTCQTESPGFAKPAKQKPYSPDLDLAPDLDLKNTAADEPPPLVLENPKPKREPVRGWQECVDAFHERYRARTGGREPTWGPKQGGMLRPLVAKHGHLEVIRRIGVLFTAPPAFLAGSPPDVATLVQHFDKLAAPTIERTMPGQKTTTSITTRPTEPYKPPTVAQPIASDAVREAAIAVLANLRKNGG